jgi:hypothetical protein
MIMLAQILKGHGDPEENAGAIITTMDQTVSELRSAGPIRMV